MWHQGVAQGLSWSQRNMLIAHIDGPQPVIVGTDFKPRYGLITRGLLRGVISLTAPPNHVKRPQFTCLTENGRSVLAWVLADYADKLIAAGFTGLGIQAPAEESVKQILENIVHRRVYKTQPE